jgi:integrase
LRVALRLAERYGEIETNPCAGVRVPVDPDGERPARILSPEEVAEILRAAEQDDERLGRSLAAPLYGLLTACGLRLGEALALPWGRDGIDLDAGVARVRRALDRTRDASGTYPFISPKTRQSRRDVPIPSGELARLRRHRLATGRPRDGMLVFADREGRPLVPQAIPRQALARACRSADIAEPWPRVHDLRHAAATHWLAAGLSAHAVARLLGHADAGLVWRRYGHALPDELAGAGAALERFRQARGL